MTGPSDIEHEYKKAKADFAKEIGRVNIMIVGNTGVGKSTLINGVFGKTVADARAGEPVTQGISMYASPDLPLNLWDSRGFEAASSEALDLVNKKIGDMAKNPDGKDHLHVVWLCIASPSNRVEPVHIKFLEAMKARGTPCIVVFTQSFFSMPEEARSKAVPCAAQVELLVEAQPGAPREPFGLEDLVDATFRVLPDGVKTAFNVAQQVQWQKKKELADGAVKTAVAAAGATAAFPGHAVSLFTIQTAMCAKIDSIYGVKMIDGHRTLFKLVAQRGAGQAGKWLFGVLLSDGLKASGIGYFAGVAIGGAVGASITGAMGYAYVEGISRYAQSGGDIDLEALAASVVSAAIAARKKSEPQLG